MDNDTEMGHGEPKLADSASDQFSPTRHVVERSSYNGGGILDTLCRFEAQMDAKLGIESQAIERKRAEDKRPVPWHQQLSMALLWASATMNISCFATGLLGRELGLDLRQSIVVIIFASLLGGALTGYCATFGAAMGLRQISVGRFSFGWFPNMVPAVLNAIQQMGWSAVSCITAGLALTAVSDGRVSLVVGIIVVAVVGLVISFIGLRSILVYERYAWIVFFIIFMIIFGETGKFADNSSPAAAQGVNLSASVLNLLAIVYGSSASWATMVSDYYVHYPANTSRTKIFLMTMFGVAIPTSIGMISGAVVASAFKNRPEWDTAYHEEGLGYLVQDMLYPRGFAKFLLTLFVLSGINALVIGIYSSALSLQQVSSSFSRLPRFMWTLLCFACIIALALGGREQLNTYLQNFLSLLGYWETSYGVILLQEHYIFRKGNFANYDLDGWNDPARLPHGFAATVAFCLGVVGWVMGMVQTWFVGPVARMIGDGGDVANEMTFAITVISYLPARYIELKYFGR